MLIAAEGLSSTDAAFESSSLRPPACPHQTGRAGRSGQPRPRASEEDHVGREDAAFPIAEMTVPFASTRNASVLWHHPRVCVCKCDRVRATKQEVAQVSPPMPHLGLRAHTITTAEHQREPQRTHKEKLCSTNVADAESRSMYVMVSMIIRAIKKKKNLSQTIVHKLETAILVSQNNHTH